MRIRERVKRLEDSAGEAAWYSSPEAVAEAERILDDWRNGRIEFPPETSEEELKNLREYKLDRSYMDEAIPEAEKRAIAAADEILDRMARQRIAELEAELGIFTDTRDRASGR